MSEYKEMEKLDETLHLSGKELNYVNLFNEIKEAVPFAEKVANQMGFDVTKAEDAKAAVYNLLDIRSADQGVGGFIYYDETNKFFNDNAEDILDYAKEMSDDLGENLSEFINSFNCLNTSDVVEDLLLNDGESVKNALAWFALEETANRMNDLSFELTSLADIKDIDEKFIQDCNTQTESKKM